MQSTANPQANPAINEQLRKYQAEIHALQFELGQTKLDNQIYQKLHIDLSNLLQSRNNEIALLKLEAEYDYQANELKNAQEEVARSRDLLQQSQNQIKELGSLAVQGQTALTNQLNSARNEAVIARNEVAAARSEAALAQSDAAIARSEAVLARSEAAAARNEATIAKSEAEFFRKEVEKLQEKLSQQSQNPTQAQPLFIDGYQQKIQEAQTALPIAQKQAEAASQSPKHAKRPSSGRTDRSNLTCKRSIFSAAAPSSAATLPNQAPVEVSNNTEKQLSGDLDSLRQAAMEIALETAAEKIAHVPYSLRMTRARTSE